jgi:hypothetical protein
MGWRMGVGRIGRSGGNLPHKAADTRPHSGSTRNERCRRGKVPEYRLSDVVNPLTILANRREIRVRWSCRVQIIPADNPMASL